MKTDAQSRGALIRLRRLAESVYSIQRFCLMLENIRENVLHHSIFGSFRRLDVEFREVVERDTDSVVVQELGESRWGRNMGRYISNSVDDWFRHL